MSEEKFASLSSGLLARKGAAKPAMRRQGFINPQGDVTEDLGWNDMGFEAPKPIDGETEYHGEAPLPEVRRQQDQLAEGLGEVDRDEADAAPAELPMAPDADHAEREYEPYKANGRGGLTPMDATDEEPAPEMIEDDAAEEADAATNGAETGLRVHGASSLSEKKSAKTKTPSKPKEKNVPAREKVAFTLRLDKDRHLKLRLASAVTNQSAQRLVTEALDRFLEEHPDVRALSGQASGDQTH
ncbi:MAG: hypothetical protein AAGE05_07500 [Pseudomonadota bacterium]